MANKKSGKSAAGQSKAAKKRSDEERTGTKVEARKGKRAGKAVKPPDNKRGGGS